MERKPVTGIMLTLVLIGMLTLAFNIQPVKADWAWTETIYIKADGSVYPVTAPISSVDNVTYTLTDNIVGDVPEDTSAIVVERDNIVLDGNGYTLQGTRAFFSKGISLSGRSNVTIRNVEIKAFYWGVYLSDSSNNTISGNNITKNGDGGGIEFSSSSNNAVSGNTITENTYDGIKLHRSVYNAISGNTIKNNKYGVSLWDSSNYNSISGNNITQNNVYGIELAWSSNYNIISGNDITTNREGIWLWETSSNTISGNNITANDEHGIILYWSSDNMISGNTATNNMHGISLGGSSDNTISGNSITQNNLYGVELFGWSSNYNSVTGNNITNNEFGIWLWETSNNNIYHNNFIDNTNQTFVQDVYTNIWDDGYPSGGNYWSDHVTVDDCCGINQDEPGSDGIVDEPYIIDWRNRDHYPLVEPWSPAVPAIPATINIEPDTLNLRSKGKWITSYIELPEGYDVADVDVSTVMLNDIIPVSFLDVPAPEPVPTEIGDYDSDGITDLMVRFSRQDLIAILSVGEATLTITGKVNDTTFEGSDTIRVIDK